jgi:hypothetical protein
MNIVMLRIYLSILPFTQAWPREKLDKLLVKVSPMIHDSDLTEKDYEEFYRFYEELKKTS